MNFNKWITASALLFFMISCGSQSRVITTKEEPETKAVESNPVKQSGNTGVEAYIVRYRDIAKEEMKKYGIPASITLAQGILESGAGTSELAAKANNHFGIKCDTEWQGKKAYHKGHCFRKYEDPRASFEDHSLFLKNRTHYKSLFLLSQDDYVSWAKGLKNAGYATDSKYPEKLTGIIERYQLYKYDAEILEETPQATTTSEAGEEVYVVKEGDTLYSISRKYGLTVDALMRMNGLSTTAISIGQSLKVSTRN